MFVDSKGKRFYTKCVQLKDVIFLRDLIVKMFLRTWWWGFQALYFCVPFKDQLSKYCGQNKIIGNMTKENLPTCLSELFP